jgi:septum formation protein
MTETIILASGSEIRAQLLRNACVPFDVVVARVDEETIRASMQAEQASPRDVADMLALW